MEELKNCPACGGTSPGAAKFCQHCGSRLDQPAPPPPPSPAAVPPAQPTGPAPAPPRPPLFDLEATGPPPANPPLSSGSRIQIWEPPPPPPPTTPVPPPPAPEPERPCPACGQPLPETANFCRHCGAKKTTPPPPPAPTLTSCTQCGQEVDVGAKFCRHCGAAVTEAGPPAGLCPQCQQPVSPEARFCRLCGAQLDGAPAPGPAPGMPPPPPGLPSPSLTAPNLSGARYAGFWWRALALVLDAIGLSFITGSTSALFFGLSPTNPAALAGSPGWYSIVTVVIFWLYFALPESSTWQASPGKIALGLVVTDLQGRRLSFGRASGRTFGKYISGLLLGFGYIMAGFTRRKQALHDMMAGCLVWKQGQ